MRLTGYGGLRTAAVAVLMVAFALSAAMQMSTAAMAAERNQKQTFAGAIVGVTRGAPAAEQAVEVTAAAEMERTVFSGYESRGTMVAREVSEEAGQHVMKQKLNRSSDADVKRASEARTCSGLRAAGNSSGVITGDTDTTVTSAPPETVAKK
jgi:hypothetical protein